jgi:hypothetical protein
MQLNQSKPLNTFLKNVNTKTTFIYNNNTLADITFIAFGGNAWRNGLIAIIAGVAWFRIDQHVTQSGDVIYFKKFSFHFK